MAKTNRRDESKELFWRNTMASFGKSGQTVCAFCRQRHISENQFYAWRSELRQRDREVAALKTRHGSSSPLGSKNPTDPEKTSPAFATVRIKPDAADWVGLASDEIEIRLMAGTRLRFRGGCPTSLLETALAILERRGC